VTPGAPLPGDPGESGGPASGGLLDSARRMLATLLALASTRLELLTTELEEEMHRIAGLLLWSVIAVFCGGLAVLMLAITLLVMFWDDHRVLVAWLITGAFAAGAIVSVLLLKRRAASRPRLLAASLDELRRDSQALRGPE
jgi:uncharacterized membrane protein YqjE